MRRSLIAIALAVLALPGAALAQEATEDDDAAAMMEMLSQSDGLPQFDAGDEDNGWFLSRRDGVCRMYSFNDPVVLQVDPSDPMKTGVWFQMIDGEIAEAEGAAVKLKVGMRDKDEGDYAVYDATVMVSHQTVPAYVLPVPMKDFVAKFPNGVQLILADATGEKGIMRSDTLGSRKHFAELAKCAGG